ncbi:MAG TPA: VOC family protein [Acidimicrobiales bacterium]|nr:VOC family protein [Acidimicrobiales bacterium]
MTGKVVHFEIPIDDANRGSDFYRAAFGWTLERWGPMEYWTTSGGQGNGIDGALTKRTEDSPALTFYIEVEDIDDALAAIEQAGGTRLTERMPIPTVGWSALVLDTEGNRVGIFEPDPSVPLPG